MVWFKCEVIYPLNKPQMVLEILQVLFILLFFLTRDGIGMTTQIRKTVLLVCPVNEDPQRSCPFRAQIN